MNTYVKDISIFFSYLRTTLPFSVLYCRGHQFVEIPYSQNSSREWCSIKYFGPSSSLIPSLSHPSCPAGEPSRFSDTGCLLGSMYCTYACPGIDNLYLYQTMSSTPYTYAPPFLETWLYTFQPSTSGVNRLPVCKVCFGETSKLSWGFLFKGFNVKFLLRFLVKKKTSLLYHCVIQRYLNTLGDKLSVLPLLIESGPIV